MKRNLLACAALSLLIIPLSAKAGEGFSSVDRASAESGVKALSMVSAGSLAGHPLATMLAGVDIESPFARQTLAPFIESLAAEKEPATAVGVEDALAEAAFVVSRRRLDLAKRADKTSITDLNAWKGISADYDSFAASYSGYLPAHEALELARDAAEARERVSALRSGKVLERSERMAEALDERKAPETVAEAPGTQAAPASALAPSAAPARVESAPPPASVAAASAKGPETANRFNLVTAAYYLGGGLVMTAMVLFAAMNASSLGAGGLLALATAYGVLFYLAALKLKGRGYPVAGGVVATAAVVSAPIVMYFLESAAGLWDASSMNAANLLMLPILGSVVGAAAAAAKKFRFAFLAMPAAIALAGFPIVIANMLGISMNVSDNPLRILVAVSGALIVAGGAWLKKRVPDVDYGFWLSLAGGALFMGAMGFLLGMDALGFALVSALTVAAGALLDRRILALYGGAGVFCYIGSLAFRWFGDSQMLPFALIVLGGGLIASAVMFQKKFSALQDLLRARLGL